MVRQALALMVGVLVEILFLVVAVVAEAVDINLFVAVSFFLLVVVVGVVILLAVEPPHRLVCAIRELLELLVQRKQMVVGLVGLVEMDILGVLEAQAVLAGSPVAAAVLVEELLQAHLAVQAVEVVRGMP